MTPRAPNATRRVVHVPIQVYAALMLCLAASLARDAASPPSPLSLDDVVRPAAVVVVMMVVVISDDTRALRSLAVLVVVVMAVAVVVLLLSLLLLDGHHFAHACKREHSTRHIYALLRCAMTRRRSASRHRASRRTTAVVPLTHTDEWRGRLAAVTIACVPLNNILSSLISSRNWWGRRAGGRSQECEIDGGGAAMAAPPIEQHTAADGRVFAYRSPASGSPASAGATAAGGALTGLLGVGIGEVRVVRPLMSSARGAARVGRPHPLQPPLPLHSACRAGPRRPLGCSAC